VQKKRVQEEAPSPGARRGLLTEDFSDIKIVPDEDREWWYSLDEPAKTRVAKRYRKKWTDDETKRLIKADPEKEDYYGLAAEMGRTPGSLRLRRQAMVHLLRDEYGYLQKARAYEEDPKTNHRLADIGQVYRNLKELGFFALPVHEQFARARLLRQPREGWRGDNTWGVLRRRRNQADAVKARFDALKQKASEKRED
jgi:hypothetical protein